MPDLEGIMTDLPALTGGVSSMVQIYRCHPSIQTLRERRCGLDEGVIISGVEKDRSLFRVDQQHGD
jgi:hypothetical protein